MVVLRQAQEIRLFCRRVYTEQRECAPRNNREESSRDDSKAVIPTQTKISNSRLHLHKNDKRPNAIG